MQSEVWQRIEELRAEIENAARYSNDGSEAIELAERLKAPVCLTGDKCWKQRT